MKTRFALSLACVALGLSACRSQARTSAAKTASAQPTEAAATRRSTRAIPPSMTRRTLAYPSGNPATSPLLIDFIVPREVKAGDSFEYELLVINLSSLRLENVVLTESIPDDMVVTGTTPAVDESGPGFGLWRLGSLEANEERAIRVNATAGEEGSINTSYSVAYDSVLAMSIPVVDPRLELAASGASEVILCDDIEVRYVVTNSGSGTARNVLVRAPLPTGLATRTGATTVAKKFERLGPGETEEFTALLKASRTGSFTHSATAIGSDGLRAESIAFEILVLQPVLAISQTGGDTLVLGEDLQFEIVVENVGDGVAAGTWIEEDIPVGASFVSATDGGRVLDGALVWDLGDLQPEETRTVSYALSAGDAGIYFMTAWAAADCADGVRAEATTKVAAPAGP
jgi:hypothetical protein